MKLTRILAVCHSLLCSLLLATSASADPLRTLDDFLQFTTFKAAFIQKVYAEDNTLQEVSQGYILVRRPGRFVWHYNQPNAYTIASDGRKFTAYDPALAQAHISRTLDTLSNAPLMILLSRNDVSRSFSVKVLDREGSLSWLRLQPKVKDSEFLHFDVGLADGRLKKVMMYDHFKQRIEIDFNRIQVDIEIPNRSFILRLPEGTDIVDYYSR